MQIVGPHQDVLRLAFRPGVESTTRESLQARTDRRSSSDRARLISRN
jgi:hypothetical protein